jgi:hypothetical protein
MSVKVSSGYCGALASCTLVLLPVVPSLAPLPLAGGASLPLGAAAPLPLAGGASLPLGAAAPLPLVAVGPLPLGAVAPLGLALALPLPAIVAVVNGALDAGMLCLYDATNADSSGNGSSSSKIIVGTYRTSNLN